MVRLFGASVFLMKPRRRRTGGCIELPAGERRSRRIDLLQELFAQEICKKDPGFYERLNQSGLHEEDKKVHQPNSLFNDVDFNDKAYHKKYPTIYHLRHALMTENHPFDVRLVYLAIHHILKHRGHFLFENFQVDENGVSGFEESFAAFGNALEHIKGELFAKIKNWG